ncbi:MAG: Sec-independent protein translocase subunit TatA/TatB [Candidatus Hodarchaeales archaeon]
MFGLGSTELIIIAVIILFVFGVKRLPGIGKVMGDTLREFRNIKKEIDPKETVEKVQDDKKTIEEKDFQPSLEAKVVNGVLEQIPGVKKFMDVKKKAEQVKKLIE